MSSGLKSESYALDAVPSADRGGADSRARPSINASVTATVFRWHPVRRSKLLWTHTTSACVSVGVLLAELTEPATARTRVVRGAVSC